MENGQAKDGLRPFSYIAKDFRENVGDTYSNHTEKEVQAEIQAIADSSLNSVLLGLSGSLDPQPRYVGLTLGDIPLTNADGEFNADPDLTVHQLQASLGHSAAEVPFPVRVPHALDENNQLMMQELQLIHQSEKQQRLRMFHQSVDQQQQQLHNFQHSLEQQHHHQHSFHQPAQQQQYHQQFITAENDTTGRNQAQNPETQKDRKFSYGGVDHKGPGFLTAWEESVKFMENLRQLQEQHVQQQHQPPILQTKSDQFCLNDVPLGVSSAQNINSFGEFDPVHQENAFPREKLPAKNIRPDFCQPSSISIPTISSSACTVMGFPGSSASVLSPGPTNRRLTGPVNSCHSPGANPFGYQVTDRNSHSQYFGTNDIQPPAVPYVGLPNKLMTYNSVPAAGSGAFSKFFNNYNAAPAAASTGIFSLDVPIKPTYSVDQELQLDYGRRSDPRDVFGAPETPHSHFLQEIPRRSKSAAGRLLGDLETKPLHHFATERQRREHLNEKYQTLRSLVPNPTKADRASIVSDAINRIHELKRKEETLLAEKRDRQSRKQQRNEMRSNGKRPRLGVAEMDPRSKDEGEDVTLKTQWIKKVSKHGTEVEVRIFCGEVEVTIKQIHTPKFLVRVMTAIELGLKLQILDGNGGVIKDYDIYRFRLKMKGESCAFIGLIATKLLEILDAVF